MEKDKANASDREKKVNFEKWFDEDLDTILCCGLDPNRPEGHGKYDVAAAGRYLRENDKDFSDLTPEEIEMFRFKP